MGRSKELFEYLRQSGMYSKDSPEAEEARAAEERERQAEEYDTESAASERSKGPRGREHDVARAMVEQLANRARRDEAHDRVEDEDDVVHEVAEPEPAPVIASDEPDATEAPASEPQSNEPRAPRRKARKRATPKPRERSGDRAGKRAPERAGARHAKGAAVAAAAKRPRGTDKSQDAADDSVASFGDQTFSFSYNNAALALLFFASLTVLSYFLGFTQGMGDPVQRTPAAYMGEFPINAGNANAGNVTHEGTPAEHPATPETTPAPPDGAGFLEGNRVYHSICVFQADERNGAIAKQHLNQLQAAGYDAWSSVDSKGRHRVWVGRYEEECPELHDLLAELRNKELESDGDLSQTYDDAYISQVTPGP